MIILITKHKVNNINYFYPMSKLYKYSEFINETKFITNVTLGYYKEPENVTENFEKIIFSNENSQEKVKKVNKFLKENKGNLLYLYHGTSNDNNLEDEGILTTKIKTKKSIQSQPGFVYLSIYKDSAKLFGSIAYPYTDTKVVKVETAISNLKPDEDQIYNIKINTNDNIGDTLGDSAVFGNGFRIKGNVPSYMIKDVEIYKK